MPVVLYLHSGELWGIGVTGGFLKTAHKINVFLIKKNWTRNLGPKLEI
jgi:hypothetical protein